MENVILKTKEQIKSIRKSCKIVAFVLSELEKNVKPRVSTWDLNMLAEELCYMKGATPGFKGYRGFPYSICSSVNEEVVHGFPSKENLKEGDIISIDFGVVYKGWYGDAAFTAPVGEVSKDAKRLLEVGKECLDIGIAKAIPFGRLGDISTNIQQHAENKGYNVIRDFVGHGIGKNLHEFPQIPNYGNGHPGLLLKPGMTIAIEPMITAGSYEIKTSTNGWTISTKDAELSAHFENSIVITENGPEILTAL
jgi:methionyl aminopeptidase